MYIEFRTKANATKQAKLLRRLALVFLASFFALPETSESCGLVTQSGTDKVKINQENVLIYLEPEKKLEHLVREINFLATDDNFGFIVPTPNKPEIVEVDNKLFSTLRDIQSRNIQVRTVPRLAAIDLSDRILGATSPVEVLEQETIGPLDVFVVRANDTESLVSWLKDRHYRYRPEIAKWLEHYTNKNYYLSIFQYSRNSRNVNKCSKDEKGTFKCGSITDQVSSPCSSLKSGVYQCGPKKDEIISTSIRMSFKTEVPFFPYQEPRDQASPIGRVFQLYLLSPSGQALKSASVSGKVDVLNWESSFDLPELDADKLASQMHLETKPPKIKFYAYVDRNNSRVDRGDLYFEEGTFEVVTKFVEVPEYISLVEFKKLWKEQEQTGKNSRMLPLSVLQDLASQE